MSECIKAHLHFCLIKNAEVLGYLLICFFIRVVRSWSYHYNSHHHSILYLEVFFFLIISLILYFFICDIAVQGMGHAESDRPLAAGRGAECAIEVDVYACWERRGDKLCL
tara:strand:+ start:399 stop:728 length:330 start_codon:yes stop_codon:yes gene_type:complete